VTRLLEDAYLMKNFPLFLHFVMHMHVVGILGPKGLPEKF